MTTPDDSIDNNVITVTKSRTTGLAVCKLTQICATPLPAP